MRTTMAKYMKWLLPILFIAYYTSIASFMHVHIEHGVTIVHSHPFSKASGGPSHHHASLSEIQLFHILTTISAEDGAVHSLQLDFYTQQIAELAAVPVCPDYLHPIQGKLSLRAPPVI